MTLDHKKLERWYIPRDWTHSPGAWEPAIAVTLEFITVSVPFPSMKRRSKSFQIHPCRANLHSTWAYRILVDFSVFQCSPCSRRLPSAVRNAYCQIAQEHGQKNSNSLVTPCGGALLEVALNVLSHPFLSRNLNAFRGLFARWTLFWLL